MHLPHDATLLRIFFGEYDRWKRQPLCKAIVLKIIDYRADPAVESPPEI